MLCYCQISLFLLFFSDWFCFCNDHIQKYPLNLFQLKKWLFNDMEVLMELFPFSFLLKKELQQTFSICEQKFKYMTKAQHFQWHFSFFSCKKDYIYIYVYTYLYLPKAVFTKKYRRSSQNCCRWLFFFKFGTRDCLWGLLKPVLLSQVPHQERKEGWKIYCINLWAPHGTHPLVSCWSFPEIHVFWHT